METEHQARLFARGLDSFNTSHFYEAHEHWEEVWLQTSNPEKRFLQGLIQVAAAFHHYSRANRRGTRNLLREGLDKLNAVSAQHRGLNIEQLRVEVRAWLNWLDDGDSTQRCEIPRIRSWRL